MKYLLVLAVVLVAAYLWRSARRDVRHQAPPSMPKAQSAQAPAQEMVTCAECGIHVPQSEATQGVEGVYCSTSHRQLREG